MCWKSDTMCAFVRSISCRKFGKFDRQVFELNWFKELPQSPTQVQEKLKRTARDDKDMQIYQIEVKDSKYVIRFEFGSQLRFL